MTSVGSLIGLTDRDGALVSPSLAPSAKLDPNQYPSLAPQVRALGTDIRAVYADAWAKKEQQERVQDKHFLERAREYVELNEQVQTSTSLLADLASFLSTFQRDLSAVSGHISELQGRSKTIEARLAARKTVERSLHPLVASIVITPSLIQTIAETEVTDAWIPAVQELDAKLGAIRSGPRIESRKSLDDAAEALRLLASQKILAYLVSLLKPFALSVTISLQTLQTSILLPSKPLFDFLRRHATKQAHEFQKAYVSTVRWYYETGFRRYVRGLEKMRIRGLERGEPIGEVTMGSKATLALLAKKNLVVSGEGTRSATAASLDYSQISGPGVALAFMAGDSSFRPPPEALFRSVSLVLMDNAETEYSFITTFFGQHSSLSVPSSRSESPPLFAPLPDRSRDDGEGESVSGSDAGKTSITGSLMSRDERGEKLRRAVVEGLWKSVLEPAQEYAKNFASALLEPTSPPTPVSILSMIRLNEAVIASLIDERGCPAMEAYLIDIRLTLWPAFARVMDVQTESLRKVNGAGSATSLPGRAIGTTSVKDSAVQIIALRYTELFTAFVALSGEQDEEMVFGSVLRLRQEVDRLLLNQAARITDPGKQRAFLSTHYEELLQGLSAGISTHPRSQTELSHYRELARKVQQ